MLCFLSSAIRFTRKDLVDCSRVGDEQRNPQFQGTGFYKRWYVLLNDAVDAADMSVAVRVF